MEDEVIGIYETEEAINNVLNKLRKYSYNNLVKTSHFLYSIEEKGTDLKLLEENFIEFDKVKLIIKRKHKSSGKISHDFYYKLNERSYLMYAISFEDEKPVLINAFAIDRSFERFRDSVINSFKDKLMSQ